MSFQFNFGGPPRRDLRPPSPLEAVAHTLELVAFTAAAFVPAPPHKLVEGINGLPLRRAVVDFDAVSGTHMDVVRRSYEGGAKTWECTYDLLQLLGGESGRPYVVRKRVLDLGCGTGLLGAAALLLGAAAVAFADLNAPVLCHVTAANIALNPPPDGPPAGAAAPTLIAGDWAALRDAVQRGAGPLTRYEVDTVLSSETLYDPAAYGVLLDLLSLLLEPSAGVALFATKRFYFGDGLGGGTTAFLDACAARRTPALSAQCVATVEDGQSMIRDIVAVRITAT